MQECVGIIYITPITHFLAGTSESIFFFFTNYSLKNCSNKKMSSWSEINNLCLLLHMILALAKYFMFKFPALLPKEVFPMSCTRRLSGDPKDVFPVILQDVIKIRTG